MISDNVSLPSDLIPGGESTARRCRSGIGRSATSAVVRRCPVGLSRHSAAVPPGLASVAGRPTPR
jgi:hypothetical protein